MTVLSTTGDLLRKGLEMTCGTMKEAGRVLGYTPGMLSKICSGERNISPEVERKMAKISILAGIAMAAEATGYTWFRFFRGDRHPLNMALRALKEDRECDAYLEKLPERLMDKPGPEHLTGQDKEWLAVFMKELDDDIEAKINLRVEITSTYCIGSMDELTSKENTPATVAPAARVELSF